MSGWENPAAALRKELRARFPGAMVRWDASGRALVITDAPRRGYSVTDVPVENGLAFYDLPLNKMITPPAPVFGAYADGVFALQAALAMTLPGGGARQLLTLSGMPGRMAVERGALVCATEGFMHTVSLDGSRLLHTRRVPGRAAAWQSFGETLLVCDVLTEQIDRQSAGGQWSLFCGHARDMRSLFGQT